MRPIIRYRPATTLPGRNRPEAIDSDRAFGGATGTGGPGLVALSPYAGSRAPHAAQKGCARPAGRALPHDGHWVTKAADSTATRDDEDVPGRSAGGGSRGRP